MYTTCLFCNESLGKNDMIELFPVGRRIAFDAEKGRLWVICPHCTRWNLSPIEERWEAIEDCERRFRATHLRYSTDNIGLAQLREGLELVRIGKALRPEVAAWRYGDVIQRRGSGRLLGIATGLVRRGVRSANEAITKLTRDDTPSIFADDPLTRLRLYRHRERVLDVLTDERGNRFVIRWGHLDAAELIRPDPHQPWRLVVKHDQGLTTVTGDDGLRTAGKVLAALKRKAKGEEAREGPVDVPEFPWPEAVRVPPPWAGGDGRAADDPRHIGAGGVRGQVPGGVPA